MYTAIVLPCAQWDIEEAARWYHAKEKGLGKKFTAQLRAKVRFIQENPKTTSLKSADVRVAILDKFPFMVYYVVDDVQKTIQIIAILHTSRDPNLIRSKMRIASTCVVESL